MAQNKANKKTQLKLIFDQNGNSEELTFSYICKFIRDTFGFTQPEMAKKLNVSLCAYKFWEYGKREPSSKAAANLSIMYLQALYLTKQTPTAIDIKLLLDWLLTEQGSEPISKSEKITEAVCA